MLAIAFLNVARTSPTLPPSAIRTSAMGWRLPGARQDDSDILENRGDRRVRFVYRDLDRADPGKGGQYGIGYGAGRALQQFVIGIFEGRGRGGDHIGIGHGIGEAIGARGFRQVGRQFEIDHEALADLRLMFHDAMTRMYDDAGDEDHIGHRLPQIAAATRSACTVCDTSWVLMIRAPRSAAIRCAAIEPPTRSCGSEGDTELMKHLRDAPTNSGRPNPLNSSSRASAVMLCSGVLPKPTPGSSTMLSGAMPAFAAISSDLVKNAAISCIMSMPAST